MVHIAQQNLGKCKPLGYYNRKVAIGLLTGLALIGAKSRPAAAQTSPTSESASAAPAVSPNGFDMRAAAIPSGRPPVRRSVTLEQERSGLRADAPSYFSRIFHSIFQSPLPTQIFEQGGVPAVVPEREVDGDPTGRIESYQPLGATTTATNAFFQSLGANGRSCVTCHLPPNAMSVSVDNINVRWNATSGTDPIFAAIDGANCPNKVSQAAAGTLDPRTAHSLLLDRGLFRIFIAIPDNAEFTVQVLNDPTNDSIDPAHPNGCNTDPAFATSKDVTTGKDITVLSMYRRPRIAASLPFVMTTRNDVGVNPTLNNDPITGTPVDVQGVKIDPRTGRPISGNIMWDGREPTLEHQASDATQGHAQAPNPPTSTQIAEMVQFELGIFSAQIWDAWTLSLTGAGGLGGPVYLSGGTPGLPPQVNGTTFPLYDAWSSLAATADRVAQRASVANGEKIFQTQSFTINGVAGLSNIPGIPATGTCSTCHNQVNTGNDSFPAAQHDVGIGGTTPAPGVTPPVGAPNTIPAPSSQLPIFKLTCAAGKSTVYQGPVVQTNDPGLALITGQCADIGRFTVPQLRGLAARAPYFSDGSAATLLDVVTFYNKRFNIGLTDQNIQDLVAFLRSL
jgi:cytochrome c peroxidase